MIDLFILLEAGLALVGSNYIIYLFELRMLERIINI